MIFKGIKRGLVKAQTGINTDVEELNLSSMFGRRMLRVAHHLLNGEVRVQECS